MRHAIILYKLVQQETITSYLNFSQRKSLWFFKNTLIALLTYFHLLFWVWWFPVVSKIDFFVVFFVAIPCHRNYISMQPSNAFLLFLRKNFQCCWWSIFDVLLKFSRISPNRFCPSDLDFLQLYNHQHPWISSVVFEPIHFQLFLI